MLCAILPEAYSPGYIPTHFTFSGVHISSYFCEVFFMNVKMLNIESRKRRNPLGITSPTDFYFTEGDTIDAQVIVENPNISIYCLDHENRRTLFVETPTDIDLSKAPFYYQAQYENAVNLFAVSYEVLHRLADNIRIDSKQLILIYSVGRCGSTLISSALNQAENIVSLSEPDIYTQLVEIREWDGSNDADVSELLQTCTKILCKSSMQNTDPHRLAIKFRSFCIEIADLMFKYLPDAKIIFLYRDVDTWLKSSVRAFVHDDINSVGNLESIQAWLRQLVSLIDKHLSENSESLSIAKIGTLMWLSMMERYIKLHQEGVPMLAVRFNTLTILPKQVIKGIFDYCDISISDFEDIFKIFDRDSQEGTVLSRTNIQQKSVKLSDDILAEMRRTLLTHPTIQTPHFVLPNTLHLDVGA